MDFGIKLKALRHKKGMTQSEVAAMLGLTNRAVGAWESGKSRPRLDKLTQLADLFDVSVSYLTDADSPSLVGSSSSLQKISGGGGPP